MKKACAILLFAFSALWARGEGDFNLQRVDNWHQWRGPNGNGVAPRGSPPIRWNEELNVRWKREIPGEGSGTPIVWGDQVFVVTAIETDRESDISIPADARALTKPPGRYFRFVVMSFHRETGAELWRRVAVVEVPHEGHHRTHSYAGASPVTDGARLFVSFGSRGIFCFDVSGNLIWKRDLGDMRTRYGWGEATSPVLHGDTLIVNWDHEDQSFIVALDAETGVTRWKKERDEPSSWATPLVAGFNDQTQVIVNGASRVRSYDLTSGAVIWECGGLTINCIPSPVRIGETVICMSGYRGAAVLAIPLASKGDLTGTAQVAWNYSRGTPYVPSPILYDDQVYFTSVNRAILTSLNVSDGKPVFEQERISGLGTLYSSPVGALGHIYFVDRDGLTVVIKHGSAPEVVARNQLEAQIDASPAIVGAQLFMRGRRSLYCIEKD